MKFQQIQAIKQENEALSPLGESILRSLAYAEVFKYPLTRQEILSGMDEHLPDSFTLEEELEILVENGHIFENDGFYYLKQRKNIISRRKDLNHRAEKYLKKAHRISRLIGQFPFVRGVFLSGSITKNSMEKDGDIDYFVITAPGHLWVARTLLILFKKVFLLNSYKYFCLNYFLDSKHMEIEDKNLYVAHEINTLIPTYGKEYCEAFLQSNTWTSDFLPNHIPHNYDPVSSRVRGIKWFLETILKPGFAHTLESLFRKQTESHWKKKFNRNKKDVKNAFRTGESISALHPENFKLKIISRYREILKDQESKLGTDLS